MEIKIGKYQVKREKAGFFAVYDTASWPKTIVTHKRTWRQATKTAVLLKEAFDQGFAEARDIYYEDAHRY